MDDFDLNVIAARLEGLEETIISKLIDRAQFGANPCVYQRGHSGFEGEATRSLFEIRLLHQEQMDALFGRFCVPEERPFNDDLPPPKRKVNLPDTGLRIRDCGLVSVTHAILDSYLALVPSLCQARNDGHYGSSVEHDIYALQAISRRIHYGALWVAESKFRSAPGTFRAFAEAGDAVGLLAALTRSEVEERIISRVRDKVVSQQATVNRSVRHVISPEVVVEYYRNVVIPLTKKGEVLYLLNRSADQG